MTPQLAFPLLRVANRAGFVTCSTRGRLGVINLGITPDGGIEATVRHLGSRKQVRGIDLGSRQQLKPRWSDVGECDGYRGRTDCCKSSQRDNRIVCRGGQSLTPSCCRVVVHYNTAPIGKKGMSDRNGECLSGRSPDGGIPHMPGTSIQEKRVRPPAAKPFEFQMYITPPSWKRRGGRLLGTLPEPALGPFLVI